MNVGTMCQNCRDKKDCDVQKVIIPNEIKTIMSEHGIRLEFCVSECKNYKKDDK
jgi:hypothetical protein